MAKQLVLAGGGHAHLVTLANIHEIKEKGFEVVVIGPSIHHYYSGMGPGMLGRTYSPEEIRFATKHVVEKQGGRFVLGSVTHVDPEKRTVYLESGETISYDVISFNTGSYVPQTLVTKDDGDIFTVKPIEKLIQAQKRIIELTAQKKISIGIVGGGPSSAEIAGNMWQLLRGQGEAMPGIHIFSGRRYMARFPKRIREMAVRSLTRRGIEIHEQGYVGRIQTGLITLESGQEHSLDLIFIARGVKPYPVFERSGLATGPDEGLLVNRYLQCPDYPEIFGGGDCIHFEEQPLDKVGVYAVRENPVLFNNLVAALEGSELMPFDPGGDYLMIFNMGGETGILRKSWLVFGGRLAFKVKDYIDRRFMRRFQSIE